MSIVDDIHAQLATLNEGERRLAELRVERILRRKQALADFPTPGHLAKFLDHNLRQTPLMQALDRVVLRADAGMDRRWIVSTPPQEGKTTRMGVCGPLWLLLRNPARRIVVASYEQGLAARSTLAVRQAIETHGGGYKGSAVDAQREDRLGLLLDPDQALQTNWMLADTPGRRNGSMTAVGIGGALTGRAAEVMVVDDAVKGAKEADSPQQRKAVWDWFQSVVTTRLAPGALVIVIGTRWHKDDLIGRLLRDDEKRDTPRWSHLVVPAQAKANDPLGRKPGEYLTSARGRTPDDWRQIRADVGERWWAALYQGDPHPSSGGVFRQAWFDRNRVDIAPEMVRIEVFVDPADNEGDGDEAGIIVLGRGTDHHTYVLADRSDHMTVGRWFRVAFLSALEYRATAVRYEQSLSGLARRAREAWRDLVRDARHLSQAHPLPGAWPSHPDEITIRTAVDTLARDDASPGDRLELQTRLIELWRWVPRTLELVDLGIPVRRYISRGTKTFRAKMIAPSHENGSVRHVGHFPELEHQMVSWQEGQDSPDRMDAAVSGEDEMARGGEPSRTREGRTSIPEGLGLAGVRR